MTTYLITVGLAIHAGALIAALWVAVAWLWDWLMWSSWWIGRRRVTPEYRRRFWLGRSTGGPHAVAFHVPFGGSTWFIRTERRSTYEARRREFPSPTLRPLPLSDFQQKEMP